MREGHPMTRPLPRRRRRVHAARHDRRRPLGGRAVGGGQPKLPFDANDIRRFVQGMDNPRSACTGTTTTPPRRRSGAWSAPPVAASAAGRAHARVAHAVRRRRAGGPTGRASTPATGSTRTGCSSTTASPIRCSLAATTYVNQRRRLHRQAALRPRSGTWSRTRGSCWWSSDTEEPDWTDERIDSLRRSFPGSTKRLYGDVEIGEEMTRRPIGRAPPHGTRRRAAHRAGPERLARTSTSRRCRRRP